MVKFIDTHTHLFAEQFTDDLQDVVKRANDEGVETMLLPNIDSSSIASLKSAVSLYPNLKGMMGLHPCSVTEDYSSQLQEIENELLQGDYVAVGEIGLDYYWDVSFKEQQKQVFIEQLKWAKQQKLPVAIHTRDSFDDAIQLVEQEQDGSLTGVFHCFGGTIEEGKRAIDTGFYLGIGGNSTFKKSTAAEVLPHLPLSRILLETDSPYLAPVPHRGKRNESAFIPIIAKNLASIYGVELSVVARNTSENAKQLFKL